MTMKSKMERAAGYVKEEIGEALKNRQMANEGRDLRNKGRMKEGKAPKTTKPGSPL